MLKNTLLQELFPYFFIQNIPVQFSNYLKSIKQNTLQRLKIRLQCNTFFPYLLNFLIKKMQLFKNLYIVKYNIFVKLMIIFK